MFSNYDTKSHISGRLGEKFCLDTFGIAEPRFEIKSTSADHSSFVVQATQLLDQLWKQYVVVKYQRSTKVVSRGKNKGKRRYTETITQAYQRKLDVYVLRGHRIMRGILDEGLKCYCTARGGDILKYGKWGIVWRVPYRVLPDQVFEETDRYNLFAFSDDPPEWTQAAVHIQGGLFSGSNNGKSTKKKTDLPQEPEENADVPF